MFLDENLTLHRRVLGPITCLNVFGMNIIILNSLDDAIELFDKRSAIYSDRPRLVFGGEMFDVLF